MTQKQEAIEALDTLTKMLDAPEPLTGLRLHLFRETLTFAKTCVGEVRELKRVKRSKTTKEESSDV